MYFIGPTFVAQNQGFIVPFLGIILDEAHIHGDRSGIGAPLLFCILHNQAWYLMCPYICAKGSPLPPSKFGLLVWRT